MIYSPFDALGIEPNIYDATFIHKAYLKAQFHAHPDKRNLAEKDLWPTVHHLEESREFLLNDCQTALAQFKSFPSTSPPNRAIAATVDNHKFKQCQYCRMIVAASSLIQHLEDHGIRSCPICSELVEDSTDHSWIAHRCRRCEFCTELLPEHETSSHLAKKHRCPFCSINFSEDFVRNHIYDEHKGIDCEGCDISADSLRLIAKHRQWTRCPLCKKVYSSQGLLHHLADVHIIEPCTLCIVESRHFSAHLREYHKSSSCPYCNTHIDQTKLESHLHFTHCFRRCQTCGSTFKKSHVQESHPAHECEACGYPIESAEMKYHLLVHHSWKQCDCCDSIEPDKAFEEHRSSHHFTPCRECKDMVVRERYHTHLQQEHAYKACPLCDAVEPRDSIRQHLQVSHSQTEQCELCGAWETKIGLRCHQRELHAFEECGFCHEVFPQGLLRNHVAEEHEPRQCLHCTATLSKTEVEQHLISTHSYQQCPFCLALEPALLIHIRDIHFAREVPEEHQFRSQPDKDFTNPQVSLATNKQGRCSKCNGQFANVYEHMRRRHGVTKRSTAQFKEPRVFCELCQKHHSKSNKSRCHSE